MITIKQNSNDKKRTKKIKIKERIIIKNEKHIFRRLIKTTTKLLENTSDTLVKSNFTAFSFPSLIFSKGKKVGLSYVKIGHAFNDICLWDFIFSKLAKKG